MSNAYRLPTEQEALLKAMALSKPTEPETFGQVMISKEGTALTGISHDICEAFEQEKSRLLCRIPGRRCGVMDKAEVKELRRLAKIELPSWGDTHKVFNALPELLDAAEMRSDAMKLLAEGYGMVTGLLNEHAWMQEQLRVLADENADLRDEWPAEALRNLDKSELIMTEIKQVRALNEQLTADLAARDAENARLNKELEMAEADNQALIERTHIQDNRRESQQGYVRHLQSLLEIARQPNKLLLQECAAKDKEIARLRDAAEHSLQFEADLAMWQKTATYWKDKHDEVQADLTCRSEQYRQATALIQVQREEIAEKDTYIERLRTAIEDALSYPDVDETMCPWCEMVDALEVRK